MEKIKLTISKLEARLLVNAIESAVYYWCDDDDQAKHWIVEASFCELKEKIQSILDKE